MSNDNQVNEDLEAYNKFKESFIRTTINNLTFYHTEILEKEVGNLEDQSYWSLHDFWGSYIAEIEDYEFTDYNYYEDRNFREELEERLKEAGFVVSEKEIEEIDRAVKEGTCQEVCEYCSEYESKYIYLAHQEDEEAYEREQEEDEDDEDLFEEDDEDDDDK